MNRSQDESASCGLRKPADVRVVTYFLVALAGIQLLLCVLLITRVFTVVTEESRRVLFGFVTLSTGLSSNLYLLLRGSASLLCAWGLARGQKLAWWFVLAYWVYSAVEDLLLLPQQKITPAISAVITIGIIVWLCFRRDLYVPRRRRATRDGETERDGP